MKSCIMASSLLTIAFGNLLVTIIEGFIKARDMVSGTLIECFVQLLDFVSMCVCVLF